jgi:hypothetical protein
MVYMKLVLIVTYFQEDFLFVVWHISICRVHIIHENYMCIRRIYVYIAYMRVCIID